MNKVILLGRLTKDPEIRYSQANNFKVANFTLAVNRKYVKEGEERQADFLNIVTFSKLAEFVEKYLKQGLQICLCGRLQTRTYDDNNGQRHYLSEIIAEEIDFADRPKKADESVLWLNNTTTNQENTERVITDGDYATDPDDLPF
jgi:single-strand DNA-binding protein